MSDHENLLLKLRQEASGYSPTQQKLGEFVLSDPGRVLYLTITELARESHTSEASVTRLCRTLGCKGYNEFKMALALDIQQGQPARQAGDEIDNVVDESVQALQDTARLLDRTLLEKAALALTEALTRIGEQGVSEALYGELREHFSEVEISELAFTIAVINRWNRLQILSQMAPGALDSAYGLDRAELH